MHITPVVLVVHITPVVLVVHMLAVHRLIQLWTTDRLTRPLRVRWARWWYLRPGWYEHQMELRHTEITPQVRQYIDDQTANLREMDAGDLDDYARNDESPPEPVYLAYCWWCFGLWCSIGYTLLAFHQPWMRTWVSVPLATSTVAVLVAHVVAATARDAH